MHLQRVSRDVLDIRSATIRTHPIRAIFDNVRIPIRVLTKVGVPDSASQGVSVFENDKVRYRNI